MSRSKIELKDRPAEYQKGYRAGYQKGLSERKRKDTDLSDISKMHLVGVANWIGIGYDGYADGYPVIDEWECSNCGREVRCEESDLDPFCGSCGSRMTVGYGEDCAICPTCIAERYDWEGEEDGREDSDCD